MELDHANFWIFVLRGEGLFYIHTDDFRIGKIHKLPYIRYMKYTQLYEIYYILSHTEIVRMSTK